MPGPSHTHSSLRRAPPTDRGVHLVVRTIEWGSGIPGPFVAHGDVCGLNCKVSCPPPAGGGTSRPRSLVTGGWGRTSVSCPFAPPLPSFLCLLRMDVLGLGAHG